MTKTYSRILLKLSGESLGGPKGQGFDFAVIQSLTKMLCLIHDQGLQIGIVLGGGNFFRGAGEFPFPLDRVTADQIGMLSTVLNSLCLKESLLNHKKKCRVMLGLEVPQAAEAFNKTKAVAYLNAGEIVIFGGGTGNPYFSTDTAAVLRGLEINADIIIKGTKVDGVYDDDPIKNPSATRFTELSFDEVLKRNLKVMDSPAIALCRENNFPICVLDITNSSDLPDFIQGKMTGTLIY